MALTAKITGKKLIVEIDLDKPHPSKTGVTMIVASSGGPKVTEAQIEGKNLTVNMQAWVK